MNSGCYECDIGYTLNEGVCEPDTVLPACPDGQYHDKNKVCQSCHENCTDCQELSDRCKSCSDNFIAETNMCSINTCHNNKWRLDFDICSPHIENYGCQEYVPQFPSLCKRLNYGEDQYRLSLLSNQLYPTSPCPEGQNYNL